ncbi:hypothetical protein JKP88DRAFT_72329 [Tribonema minus]|uniref:Uncharacterized protein n=1 Tax=Tribonema minus TaxID=303371 RepID=A0A835YSA6_9STRA|nr:hypothetical protein JKP88DRAFT_72329 [Tribonema minus]
MMAGLGLLTLGLMLAILAWRLIVAQAQTTPDKMPLSTFATPKPKPMPEPIAPVADPTPRDDDHETTDSSPNEGAATSAS